MERKKKIILGSLVGALVVVLIVTVKAAAKATTASKKVVGGNDSGVTEAPHLTSDGKTTLVLNGERLTGTASTTPWVKPTGGLRTASDQEVYGIPSLTNPTWNQP